MTLDTFSPSIRVKGLNTKEEEKPMDDKQILDLYWERSEAAISETSKKYGKYCRSEERRVGKECRSRWSPDH